MLGDRTVNRFNGAVHECLELCYRSPAPLACLAEYLERLRADGWRERAIDKVEAMVLRMLKAVSMPEDQEAAPTSDLLLLDTDQALTASLRRDAPHDP